MADFTPYRRLAETLAIAAVGGGALGLAGFPAGFLAGSTLATAIAALAGREVAVPAPLARVFFVVIGMSLGGVVTPETVAGIGHYPLSIVFLVLATLCVTQASALYLRWVHGWDPLGALLASLPGAMSQVMMLANETDADLRAIAVVQVLRVAVLTVAVPAGLGLVGLPAVPPVPAASHDALELAILALAASGAGYLLSRLRVPGGLVFGPMLMSAALHGSGLIHATLPVWFASLSAIGLGATIGARFSRMDVRMLLSYAGAAFGSFAVALAVSAMFAAAVIGLLPVRLSDVVVAFSPGAVDAMMILALALSLDPVYVGAHHVARVLIVSMSLPFLARRYAHRRIGAPPPKPPARLTSDD